MHTLEPVSAHMTWFLGRCTTLRYASSPPRSPAHLLVYEDVRTCRHRNGGRATRVVAKAVKGTESRWLLQERVLGENASAVVHLRGGMGGWFRGRGTQLLFTSCSRMPYHSHPRCRGGAWSGFHQPGRHCLHRVVFGEPHKRCIWLVVGGVRKKH